MCKYFVLSQSELHLPQCWGSSHLCSERGADHWATPPAPDTAPAASPSPAQPHIPGLLRLSARHGGGELSGSGEDSWTRPCDPPAPRHGLLPELPSPIPGKVVSHSMVKKKIAATWGVAWSANVYCNQFLSNWNILYFSVRSQIGLLNSPPIRGPPSPLCTAPWIWTHPRARRALPHLTSSLSPALRSF